MQWVAFGTAVRLLRRPPRHVDNPALRYLRTWSIFCLRLRLIETQRLLGDRNDADDSWRGLEVSSHDVGVD
jgi:hypothetical protein